jgi:exosortase/archaeosortase family protein
VAKAAGELLRRRAALRFGVVIAALLALVVLGPHEPVRWGPLGWLDAATAAATAALSRLAGLDVTAARYVVAHPGGFACEIYFRCTGLLPALFVAGAILASPAPFRSRWRGALLGVVAMLALNLARLVGLVAVGVHFPAAFATAHAVVGEAIVVAGVVGFWIVWARRAVVLR